jgi:3-deoxy-manno-octulosonate cytidylyltransferase (CMP-KDO synthetase)
MNAVAVIPARYGSTRFPGKPLARQTGRYLIQHVYERVCAARRVARCLIATDDDRIVAAVREFGGEAVLTRADHASGTDRIAEVVAGLPPDAADIVLNVQGDEPEIEPAYLDRLVERLVADERCPAATLACPFPDVADPRDPNRVKVVLNNRNEALYFSRSLIPWSDETRVDNARRDWLLHLGVYAYRRDFLLALAQWPRSDLETRERLEQLRVLDRGFPLAVELVPEAFAGIDTPADYDQFVRRWGAPVES